MKYLFLSIFLILGFGRISGQEDNRQRQFYFDFGINKGFKKSFVLYPFINFNVRIHKNIGAAVGYQHFSYLSPTSPVLYPKSFSDKVKFSNNVRSVSLKMFMRIPTAMPELRFVLETGPSLMFFEEKDVYFQPPHHWLGTGIHKYHSHKSTGLGFMAAAKAEIPLSRRFGFILGITQFLAQKQSYTTFNIGLLAGRLR